MMHWVKQKPCYWIMHWTVIWSSHLFFSFIRVAYASGSVRTQRSSNLSAVPSWRVSSLWQGVSGFRWSWFFCETLGYFHRWPVVYVFNSRRRSSSTKLHTTWLQRKCTAKTTANSKHVNYFLWRIDYIPSEPIMHVALKWPRVALLLAVEMIRDSRLKPSASVSHCLLVFWFCLAESCPGLHLLCCPGPLGCVVGTARAEVYHASFSSRISGGNYKMASFGWLFSCWVYWWFSVRVANGDRYFFLFPAFDPLSRDSNPRKNWLITDLSYCMTLRAIVNVSIVWSNASLLRLFGSYREEIDTEPKRAMKEVRSHDPGMT